MRHDFTHRRWGHSMEARMKDDTLIGYSWSWPVVKLGDEIKYVTEYGTAVAKVVWVKHYRDPHDMARWGAEIIERELSDQTKRMIANGEVDSPPWL